MGGEVVSVRILRCSYHGGWWEKYVGRVITVLFTDQYGHWTRDTGPMRCLQWVKVEDTSETFGGPN